MRTLLIIFLLTKPLISYGENAELHTFSLSKDKIYSLTENRYCVRGHQQICENASIRYNADNGLSIGVIGDHTGYEDSSIANQHFDLKQFFSSEELPNLNHYEETVFAPLKVKGIQENGRLCNSGNSVIPINQLVPGKILVIVHLSGNPNYPSISNTKKIETIVSLVKVMSRNQNEIKLKSLVVQIDREYVDFKVFPNDPNRRDQCK